MKKQAFAFFTMFSLILMLSVYYITLPEENNLKKSEKVIKSLDKENNDETTSMINDEIISNPNTSSEDKSKAISENEQIKYDNDKEKEYSNLIKDAGYNNSIEIKEKTIYVSVKDVKQEDKIVREIMKLLYDCFGDKYFIEISFS